MCVTCACGAWGRWYLKRGTVKRGWDASVWIKYGCKEALTLVVPGGGNGCRPRPPSGGLWGGGGACDSSHALFLRFSARLPRVFHSQGGSEENRRASEEKLNSLYAIDSSYVGMRKGNHVHNVPTSCFFSISCCDDIKYCLDTHA